MRLGEVGVGTDHRLAVRLDEHLGQQDRRHLDAVAPHHVAVELLVVGQPRPVGHRLALVLDHDHYPMFGRDPRAVHQGHEARAEVLDPAPRDHFLHDPGHRPGPLPLGGRGDLDAGRAQDVGAVVAHRWVPRFGVLVPQVTYGRNGSRRPVLDYGPDGWDRRGGPGTACPAELFKPRRRILTRPRDREGPA